MMNKTVWIKVYNGIVWTIALVAASAISSLVSTAVIDEYSIKV